MNGNNIWYTTTQIKNDKTNLRIYCFKNVERPKMRKAKPEVTDRFGWSDVNVTSAPPARIYDGKGVLLRLAVNEKLLDADV